jgi:hypothetical protein
MRANGLQMIHEGIPQDTVLFTYGNKETPGGLLLLQVLRPVK